jgi:hypothetical protein
MPFDLAESFLVAAEEALGARFPASYRKAMARANGGEVEALSGSWQLHPIADSSDRKRLARTANHVVRETRSMLEWPRFPGSAVAIATNGTGDQLVLLREGEALKEAIYYWSHETGDIEPIAGSFAELCTP